MSQDNVQGLSKEVLVDAFGYSKENLATTTADGQHFMRETLKTELLGRLKQGEEDRQKVLDLESELKDVREMYRALLKASQDR